MAAFGAGSGPIFLESLSCSTEDNDLLDCRRNRPLGLSTCGHSNDAGVICFGK